MRARPERQLYLDFIRAAATIAVILIHITAQEFLTSILMETT